MSFLKKLRNNVAGIGYMPDAALVERIDKRQILIIDRRGQPAGFVAYNHRRDAVTHLTMCCVTEELWRCGLGTDLMLHLIAEAMILNQHAVTLKVADHLAAMHFFADLGFVEVARGKGRSWMISARVLLLDPALSIGDVKFHAVKPNGRVHTWQSSSASEGKPPGTRTR